MQFAPYYFMFFVWFIGSGAQVLARPLMAFDLGATPFLVVFVAVSNTIGAMVSAPITGFLTDRFGRRPLLLAGTLIRAATLFGQFAATGYWEFFILEFIGGMGVSMWTTSSSIAMADITTTENRGRLLALRQITSRIGNLVGPATASVIIVVFHDDIRYVFLLNAASKIAVFFLLIYLVKETAPEVNRGGQKTAATAPGKLDLSFFLTKGFFALFLTTLALSMMGGAGAFGSLFPVQARELGISPAGLGQLMTLAGIIGLAVTYPNGWAVDRLGRKVTLVPGLGLLAVAALVLSGLNDMTQVYVVIALYGVGSAVSMGASQAFAADLAPADRRGTFLGIWTTISNVGSIIAPLLIGAIASQLGFAPGYIFIAVFLVVGAVFMAVFGPETGSRRARRAEEVRAAAIVAPSPEPSRTEAT